MIKEGSIVDVDVNLGPLDPGGDFEKVYAIMEEAFPPAETWPYEKAKELIAEPDYRILCVKSKKEKLAGFLAIRDFPPTFNFAEYFAIRKSMRGGRGVGSAALQRYLDLSIKPLVLEVEAYDTPQASRRINFYRKLGFHLNDLSYIQPPVHHGDPPGASNDHEPPPRSYSEKPPAQDKEPNFQTSLWVQCIKYC